MSAHQQHQHHHHQHQHLQQQRGGQHEELEMQRQEAQIPVPFVPFYGEHCLHTDDTVTYITPRDIPKQGTLMLTNFRLLFKCADDDDDNIELPLGTIDKFDKVGGSTSRGQYAYGVEIHSKDLRTLRFAHNPKEHSRRRLYELLSRHVFPLSNGAPAFCQHYQGRLHLKKREDGPTRGWTLYSVEREAQRMGIPADKWRVSDVNKDYTLCPTYPKYLIVPASASDKDLRNIARFRSKGRLPALCWYNRRNGATITRCSQPRVGMVGKRSAVDERYIETIRTLNPTHPERLRIMDARPRRNAMANQAKGLGYESASAYPNCDISFLNIHNIHVMRDSLRKVRAMCWPEPDETHWFSNLEATGWLKHIRTILTGAVSITDMVDSGRSVLIHCSDGWDRTAQLSALALLMLDPYYRTLEGFQVLIEKEWLSFGHKFGQRLGLCDKHHNDEQRSPVFLQFIDCVWQLSEFFPCAFEFNESLLIFILDEMYSCLYGTFMHNSEQAREKLRTSTLSMWDHVLAFKDEFVSPFFDPDAHMGVLRYPVAMRNLQLWQGYFLRWSTQFRPKESLASRFRTMQRITKQLELQCRAVEEGLERAADAADGVLVKEDEEDAGLRRGEGAEERGVAGERNEVGEASSLREANVQVDEGLSSRERRQQQKQHGESKRGAGEQNGGVVDGAAASEEQRETSTGAGANTALRGDGVQVETTALPGAVPDSNSDDTEASTNGPSHVVGRARASSNA